MVSLNKVQPGLVSYMYIHVCDYGPVRLILRGQAKVEAVSKTGQFK